MRATSHYLITAHHMLNKAVPAPRASPINLLGLFRRDQQAVLPFMTDCDNHEQLTDLLEKLEIRGDFARAEDGVLVLGQPGAVWVWDQEQ